MLAAEPKVGEIQRLMPAKTLRFQHHVRSETDDPERLREYAERLGADHEQWHPTGRLIYIRRSPRAVYDARQADALERLIVSDKRGNQRGTFS
jgi:hypothetical protein